MPEAPEVEVMAQAVAGLIGQRLQVVQFPCESKLIKDTHPMLFKSFVEGTVLTGVERRGKWLGMTLGGDFVETAIVYIHCSMFGHLRLFEGDKSHEPHQHDRAIFTFSDLRWEGEMSHYLVYRDIRCWGQIRIVQNGKRAKYIDKLGADALFANAHHYEQAYAKYPEKSIGELMLRQNLISGIGNMYRTELLYRCHISPWRLVKDMVADDWMRLAHCAKNTLRDAVNQGGSSIKNYEQPNGEQGRAQHHHFVYNREGRICLRHCMQEIAIGKLDGKKVYYCPGCQRR